MVDYYVDPAGNDGDNGGVGDPWASMGHAAGQMTDTDVLYVNAGAYTEPAGPGPQILFDIDSEVITLSTGATFDVSNINAASHAMLIDSADVTLTATAAAPLIIDGATTFADQLLSFTNGTIVASNVEVKRNTTAANHSGFGAIGHAGGPTVVTLTSCNANNIGQDGYTAIGTGGAVTLVCDTCIAHDCVEDGFTAHNNTSMTTSHCTSYDNGAGFSPAYSATWVSWHDYAYANTSATRGNLYMIGGADAKVTALHLGGASNQHITVSGGVNSASVATFNRMVIEDASSTADGTAGSWIDCVNAAADTFSFTITFDQCYFGGQISNHGIDDTNAGGDGKLIYMTFNSCVFQSATGSTTGKYAMVSRASRGTTIALNNTLIIHDAPAVGNGLFLIDAANDVVARNCIIQCSAAGSTGISGAGYGNQSGYNIVDAATEYAGGASAQTGDQSVTADIDPVMFFPTRYGNCDIGRGNPTVRALGDHDYYGRPKLRADADSIGPVYPQNDSALNMILPGPQFATEAVPTP